MAIKVFGEWAIEWSRVYAARIVETDFQDRKPVRVALIANFPFESDEQKQDRQGNEKQGNYIHVLHHSAAQAAWDFIKSDFIRFAILDARNETTAVDLSRVCLVSVNRETGKGIVHFDLGGDLFRTIAISPTATDDLLEFLRKKSP